MRRTAPFGLAMAAVAAFGLAAAPAHAQEKTAKPAEEKPLFGIVAIAPTEPGNARYIRGVEMAAEGAGWQVVVVDAQGSADQANAAVQDLIDKGARAIAVTVFPVASIGAGLALAEAAKVPVVTWGGGLGPGVAATNGSPGPMAGPVVDMMVRDLGGTGEVLALSNSAAGACRAREAVLTEALARHPGIKLTRSEVRIPGYFEDAAANAGAWLALRPAGGAPLAIWSCWDDPAVGAVSALRRDGRSDVRVYGVGGNPQAIDAIRKGLMTATAWQNALAEGHDMFGVVLSMLAAGKDWQPKAVEVPVVVVTGESVESFLLDHPDATGR